MSTETTSLTTESLLTTYAVDMAHARHVADLALTLFDSTASIHRLPPGARRLLEIGALLHNVGMHIDPPHHHIVGRDIVLNAALSDLDSTERAIVACLVAFHRKKVHASVEPAYLSLSKKQQQLTLRLAALLRVADGLDYNGSQTTQISALLGDNNSLTLHLAGPYAASDGARAVAKADLWQKVFGTSLLCAANGTSQPSPADAVAQESAAPEDDAASGDQPAATPTATPLAAAAIRRMADTPLAEMARMLLRRYFRRLRAEERDVRADKSIEAIHQMRVASRRLRATLMVIAAVAPERQVRAFRKEVQRIAQTAGAVRDCDVFLAQIANYSGNTRAVAGEEVPADGLAPLISALQRDRANAREQLIARLDSERYATFTRDFASFMTDSNGGWNNTLRVRDVAGSVIWQRYEALRAHEVELDLRNLNNDHSPILHELRISGKRLRYVLEVFAEALGPQADQVIDPLVALQDYLGALQDIAVAVDYVAQLDTAAQPGLAAYVASREAERGELLAGLPQRWEKVMSATYRRKLMELIIKL